MKTVLIVDNDIAVRATMKIVLESEGFEVLEAENGSAAFSIATEKKPDMIISDVIMENLNGFMLYELLRREPTTRDIPMILVTGEAQDFGAWDSENSVGYLQKPVSTRDLISEIRKRLHPTPPADDSKRKL